MDPKTPPKQPNPADNGLATKGTTDTQNADANRVTNQPRPDSAPTTATASEDEAPAAESDSATDTPTDATAASAQLDMGGDTDPGASNTSHDEPL